jgi:hypothetical protein
MHHNMKNAPYVKGRLRITKLGGGHFSWKIVRKADKWAAVDQLVMSGFSGPEFL